MYCTENISYHTYDIWQPSKDCSHVKHVSDFQNHQESGCRGEMGLPSLFLESNELNVIIASTFLALLALSSKVSRNEESSRANIFQEISLSVR